MFCLLQIGPVQRQNEDMISIEEIRDIGIKMLSLILLIQLFGIALAGTETGEFCPTCPDSSIFDGWLAQRETYEKADQNDAPLGQKIILTVQNADSEVLRTSVESKDPSSIDSRFFAEALVLPSEVSASDIVLDISPHAERYIEGAVNLNYENFFGEGWRIKPASEIATMLGDMGISRNDSVVVTGECLQCGGGPSPAAFSYWMLKYLGHDKVRLLDGDLKDWEAAGLKTNEKPGSRQRTNYTPKLSQELLATFDFVINGGAQIVDARSSENFAIASIPGAINIPYENVMENDRIRNEDELEKLFSNLSKDKAVVVYTNVGFEASLIWFALELLGYDVRLYTWRDWLENQPEFNLELTDVEAKPNPIRSGESVTITASFREKQPTVTNKSSSKEEVRLTVKGCATCGFGSPQSFANIDRNSGIVQISSTGKTPNASSGTSEDSLRCTAFIYGPDGSEVDRIGLLRTSGNTYKGIWKADVPPGVYKVDIVASATGNVETFSNMLEIEVTD
ncbi:MAG: sulfurtransferase [Methanotrichaceae archaeon]|nr:sulfurtransferase [Methanotrichaceae archaeon]